MTITAPAMKSATKAIQLSDEDRKTGVEILNMLQTVERAKRLNDHIPNVVTNIFRNDMNQPDLVKFLRKVAGFEVPDQKVVVEELLLLCYETS